MSNLNSAQFDDAYDIESQHNRRKMRRELLGSYVGIGNNFSNYPYMTGAMGTGGMETAEHEQGKDVDQGNLSENMGETAQDHVNETMGSETDGILSTQMDGATSDGSGMGGTATGVTGGLGS